MMKIKKIAFPSLSIKEIAKAMESTELALDSHAVQSVNWPNEYDYCPEVSVKLAHDGSTIYLQYEVKEGYTQALVTDDNGEVWTDSCCEFFISFDEHGYYNLEATCIGKLLLGFRQSREHAEHGKSTVMNSILRYPTLGETPFKEIVGDNHWKLTLAMPSSAFFAHEIKDLSGMKARMNVYKCGDNLSKPHFVSLFPIDHPTPNFHLPAYFGEIEFEK